MRRCESTGETLSNAAEPPAVHAHDRRMPTARWSRRAFVHHRFDRSSYARHPANRFRRGYRRDLHRLARRRAPVAGNALRRQGRRQVAAAEHGCHRQISASFLVRPRSRTDAL